MSNKLIFPGKIVDSRFPYKRQENATVSNKPYCYVQEDLVKHLKIDGFALIKGKQGVQNLIEFPDWLNEEFLGKPLPQDLDGSLNKNVQPTNERSRQIIHTSKGQPLHSDSAYSAMMPYIVVLLCNKAADNGGLSILCKIVDLIKQDHITHLRTILKRKESVTAVYGTPAGAIEREFVWGNTSRAHFAFSSLIASIKFSDDFAADLYRAMLEGCMSIENHTNFLLEQGDILVMDNTAVLHGRTAFSGERWLSRRWFSPVQLSEYLGVKLD